MLNIVLLDTFNDVLLAEDNYHCISYYHLPEPWIPIKAMYLLLKASFYSLNDKSCKRWK